MLTGCALWVALAAVIGGCVVPGSAFAGVLTAHTQPAIAITGRWVCPAGTDPIRHERETTSRDRYGEHRSTAYEVHCRDASGMIVARDPFTYVVLWLGLTTLLGAAVTLPVVAVVGMPGLWLLKRRVDPPGSR
jgi:hypothetical protein